MAKADKCVWCGEDMIYPRVLGRRGIYHLDCFRESGELAGSAYGAPPSPSSRVVEAMQESSEENSGLRTMEPEAEKKRRRKRRKGGGGRGRRG